MTDEMTVQAQRPSAMPYLLGGAGVGAAAGYGLAKYANVGFPTQAYSSWEDAVEDVTKDDTFIKEKIEKAADADKADLEKVKTNAEAIKKAKADLKEFKLPDGFDGQVELLAATEKEKALVEAENALTAANDKVEALKKAEFDKEVERLKNLEKYADPNSKIEYTKEQLENIFTSEAEADKQLAKQIVEGSTEYKAAINAPDFAKAEKEAISAAETAKSNAQTEFDKAMTTLKGKKGGESIDKELVTKYRSLCDKFTEANKNAEREITADILGKIKKVHAGWTAAIGAGALAILGLALRPKSKDV